MSHQKGANIGGIRTLEDIRLRCFIDPDTSCWLWRLSITHDGQAKAQFVLPDGNRLHTTGAKAAWILSGRKIAPGQIIYRTQCRNKHCCNPEHSAVGTKVQAGAFLHASGHLRGFPHRTIVNTKNRRNANTVLDMQKARDIRASNETAEVLAERYKTSLTTIYSVRNGTLWHEMAANTSVFTYRA